MKNLIISISLLTLFFCTPQFAFSQCPNSCNGVQDCSETGIDCGGPDCMPCESLVPNGSFECTANCFVFGLGQIQSATPWTYVDATEPSDLFNSCFTFDANILSPNNFRGNQAPRTGFGYAGFMAQNQQFSEPRAGYIQVPLTSPLVAGESYGLSFWVSLADNYGMAMGGIGAYFSVGAIAPGDYAPLNLHSISPQIQSDNFIHITDTANWTEVSGIYTATGGESHIVIGNFKTTFSPPNPFVTYTCCGPFLSYYYIDDVSLVLNTTLHISENEIFSKVKIFPNPNKGIVNIDLTTLQNVSISVFNLHGQSVFQEKNINTKIYQFEMNNSTGIYFVKILSGDASKIYKLVIK